MVSNSTGVKMKKILRIRKYDIYFTWVWDTGYNFKYNSGNPYSEWCIGFIRIRKLFLYSGAK
jgi:hypothetical protein